MPDLANFGAVIFAKDVARVARFYEVIAPMTVLQQEAALVVLASRDVQLVIHAIPHPYAEGITIETPPAAREDSYIKLYFLVESLAAARASAAALGGSLQDTSKEWEDRGFRACDGVDPEGNVVQLRERVG